MSESGLRYIKREELAKLLADKLEKAGFTREHAERAADHLSYADSRGVHSHGSVRAEYYAEHAAKGGLNTSPNMKFTKTGPSCGIWEGDNAAGFVAASSAMNQAIELAKETGVGIVGVRRMSHCGTLSYYLRMAAEKGMIAFAMSQSDPVSVPPGGAGVFFGTNPFGFAAPVKGKSPMVLDMATTVNAWGKILDAKTKNKKIPSTWAVDENWQPTEDPAAVKALLPAAGVKGFGLMMMTDVLAGTLLGLPFGPHVSAMYADLTENRNLGMFLMVINPEFFIGLDAFALQMAQMMDELHQLPSAEEGMAVKYPGENSDATAKKYQESGIPILEEVYEYLCSDVVHRDRYDPAHPGK